MPSGNSYVPFWNTPLKLSRDAATIVNVNENKIGKILKKGLDIHAERVYASTAQHSTAQHSTAQHSTAQADCVLLLGAETSYFIRDG